MKDFSSVSEFLDSLDPRQRRYFVAREGEIAQRLQASLQALARGLGAVSGLHEGALTASNYAAPIPSSLRGSTRHEQP